MVDTKRPIRRSGQHRMLGGVLGGLADWLECDPSVARVGYILLTAFTGFALGVVAYAVLWIFLPVEEPRPLPGPTENHPVRRPA